MSGNKKHECCEIYDMTLREFNKNVNGEEGLEFLLKIESYVTEVNLTDQSPNI